MCRDVASVGPYWGLRDYKIEPQVWGGSQICEHRWEDRTKKSGGTYKEGSKKRWQHSADDFTRDDRFMDGHPQIPAGATCHCGAWRGSLGLEPIPSLYVEHIIQVFREVRRILRKDGTLWLNMGDSYAGSGKGIGSDHGKAVYDDDDVGGKVAVPIGLKAKDLVGMPWRVALALQADGWWLRTDIIWAKVNPMPESVTDRPTRAHEYLFLLSKSASYYYDAEAIKQPASNGTHLRISQATLEAQRGGFKQEQYQENFPGRKKRDRSPNEIVQHLAGVNPKAATVDMKGTGRPKQNPSFSFACNEPVLRVNARTVWTIPTMPYPEAHFATFPPKLVEPCILAGSPGGGGSSRPFLRCRDDRPCCVAARAEIHWHRTERGLLRHG